MYLCQGVFRFHIDEFIFTTVFGANLEYLSSPTNQSAKTTGVKMIIFAF